MTRSVLTAPLMPAMSATRSRVAVVVPAPKAWPQVGMAKPDGIDAVIQSLLLFTWSHLLRIFMRRSCQDRGARLVSERKLSVLTRKGQTIYCPFLKNFLPRSPTTSLDEGEDLVAVLLDLGTTDPADLEQGL